MKNDQKKRISELEEALKFLLQDATDSEDKYSCINNAYFDHLSYYAMNTEGERAEYCISHKDDIIELRSLYQLQAYIPDEDEKTLSYLFREGMTIEEKLKALSDAWWYATNSGYSDAMANRLMSGQEDAQTELWELNCKNSSAIDRLWKWLKEEQGND